MGRIRTLYGFKVRQFFGPLRHSLAAVALIVVLALFTVPGLFVVGLFIVDTPIWTSARLGDFFAAGLSTFLAFDFMFALSGGTLTHQSEIDFAATSPIRPREYLVADLLFQFTVTDAFAIPALVFAGAGLGVRTGAWPQIAAAILAFLAFVALGLAVGQALGLAVAARRPGAKTAAIVFLFLLLLPAAHFAWPAVPAYSEFPFPSTAAAYLILGLLKGGSVLVPALTFALFGAAIAGVWALQGGRDVFPNLRPTMRVAFGQMDMRKTAVQQEAMTRGLSRLTRRFPVDLMRGTPVRMMTRLHLTRIVRDGSILMVALMTGIMVMAGALNREGNAALPEASFLTSGWVALLIPVILSFNWNATERANLWTVAMAPRYLGTYFRGLYRALGVLTVAIAVLAAVATGTVTALGILASGLMAVAACGISVVVVAAVKMPTDAFSLRSAIPFIVVPLVALGAGAPFVGFLILSATLPPLAVGLALAYSICVLVLFDELAVSAARRFEL